jgi:hypothetical protein
VRAAEMIGKRFGRSRVLRLLPYKPTRSGVNGGNQPALVRCLECCGERRVSNVHQMVREIKDGEPGRCRPCSIEFRPRKPRRCGECRTRDPKRFKPRGKATECMACERRRQRHARSKVSA